MALHLIEHIPFVAVHRRLQDAEQQVAPTFTIYFNLTIAGIEVAHINVYALDGEEIPENLGGLINENGLRGKLLKKIASLIPPIDFSLGSNNAITINNGNGNVNGSGNTTGGGSSPCNVSDNEA